VQKAKNSPNSIHANRNKFIFLVIMAIALYLLAPELKLFHESRQVLIHVHLLQLIYAAACIVMTFSLSSITYKLLAGKNYRFRRGIFIAFAGMFTNRLLPAGIGGIGLNFAFLRKQKYPKTTSVAIITINNLLGLCGHAALFVAVIIIFHRSIPKFSTSYSSQHLAIYIILALLLGTGSLFAIYSYRFRFTQTVRKLNEVLLSFRKQPFQLTSALISSIGLTICNIMALYFCSRSVELHISIVVLFMVFTLSIVTGTASPTPGGLGATEAGLIGGLIALHVSATNALALAIVYRLISFWLPFVCGGIVFAIIRKMDYV
jgi:uncharacterized protein (TIRG00374 family)